MNSQGFLLVLRFFGKLILIAAFPMVLAAIIFVSLIGLVIDIIVTIIDSVKLDEEKAYTRKTDRFVNRLDKIGSLIVEYVKLIFC